MTNQLDKTAVDGTPSQKAHIPAFTIFDFDQYPLHHVTFAPAKLEVAMSNGLGGDAITNKYII